MIMLTVSAVILHITPLPIPAPRFLTITDIIFVFTLITVAVTLYYPLYFRYGTAAIRTFSVFFFLAFFFLPRILTEQYYAGTFNMAIDTFYALSGIFTWLPVTLAVVSLIVVYLISMKYSQRIYSKKDL